MKWRRIGEVGHCPIPGTCDVVLCSFWNTHTHTHTHIHTHIIYIYLDIDIDIDIDIHTYIYICIYMFCAPYSRFTVQFTLVVWADICVLASSVCTDHALCHLLQGIWGMFRRVGQCKDTYKIKNIEISKSTHTWDYLFFINFPLRESRCQHLSIPVLRPRL